MNLAVNILLTIQAFLMGYSIYVFISKWKQLRFFRWLILIPAAGFLQFLFSVIVAPIMISKKSNLNIGFLDVENVKSINIIIISIYGIIEYYAICKFIEVNLESSIQRKIITWVSNLTPITCFCFLYTLPIDEIYVKKIITLALSFQLIIFSVFLLIELIFNEKNQNVLNNPIFIIGSGIFILFNSACPIYYLSGYFATKIMLESHVLNMIIFLSYIYFYSTIIYALKWIKI